MVDNQSGSDDATSDEEEEKQLSQPERDALLMSAVKDNNY